jgi:hypothetical protein
MVYVITLSHQFIYRLMVGLMVDNRLPDMEVSNHRCCTNSGNGLNGLSENILYSCFSDGLQWDTSQTGPHKC